MDIAVGQVVWSKAGRDKDTLFVVISNIDKNYVYICDGKVRPLERPKKKKIKHLVLEPIVLETVKTKLITKQRMNNAEIRKLLASCMKV